MKVLVTGAAGQVGSELRRENNPYALGLDIFGMDSSALDITDIESVSSAFDRVSPDVVINAAAYTAVDKAETERDKAMRVNAEGVRNLALAAKASGIPVFHISTDYVFDGHSLLPYPEGAEVSPLGVYGESKLKGEVELRSLLDQFIIMRTSWVFGLCGSNFPKTMLRLAGIHPLIKVVSDQRGRPTYARDIADALLGLVHKLNKNKELPWGVYHYAGDSPCTWHDLACYTITRAVECGKLEKMPEIIPIATHEYPTAAKRPGNSEFDCSLWQSVFPDQPLSDWKKGIECLIQGSA